MSIDLQNFRTWKKDPVTQALFACLARIKEEVELEMKDPYIILDDKCQIELVKRLGIIEGIETVLDITIEELKSGETDDDETKPTTSGT